MKTHFSVNRLFRDKKVVLGFILLILIFLLIIYIPRIINARLVPSENLPTWRIPNPVSKIFFLESIPPTAGSLAAGNSSVPDEYLVDPAIDSLLLFSRH
jgi:hypothetical protein